MDNFWNGFIKQAVAAQIMDPTPANNLAFNNARSVGPPLGGGLKRFGKGALIAGGVGALAYGAHRLLKKKNQQENL